MTIRVEANVTIPRPRAEVWRFMADGTHVDRLVAHEAADSVHLATAGPLAVGSTLELRGEFRGRPLAVTARVSELEVERRLTIEYVSGPFRGSRKIYVLDPDPSGSGTKVTHPSIGEFHGMWWFVSLIMRPVARKGLLKSAENELKSLSEGLSV